MPEIHIVGSCNMDLVMQVERLPAPGNTVLGGTFHQISGGKGANQAVAASRAGGTVVLHAALGADVYGDELLRQYITDGIDCTNVLRDVNNATGTAVILVDGNGENLIAVASGANLSVASPIPSANVGAYLLQGEINADAIFQTIEIASQSHIPVILNNAPVISVPERYRSCVDVLIVNEHEAGTMSGVRVHSKESANAALTQLCAQGFGSVIITLGAAGIVWSTGDQHYYQPAFLVNPVDTTAAGDTFCGAFATRFVAGDVFGDAIRYAAAAAALSTLTVGAQSSIPDDSRVAAFLASAPMTHG